MLPDCKIKCYSSLIQWNPSGLIPNNDSNFDNNLVHIHMSFFDTAVANGQKWNNKNLGKTKVGRGSKVCRVPRVTGMLQSHKNSCLFLSHSDFLSQGSSCSIGENIHWLENFIGLWSACLCERVYYYMLFRIKLFINREDEGLTCTVSLGTKSSWESWETLYSRFFHSHINSQPLQISLALTP